MFSPPQWLRTLADRAAQAIEPISETVPIGSHWTLQAGCWEVTLFVSAIEIVGGERDGQRIPTPFSVDVLHVVSLFANLYEVQWQPLAWHSGDEAGPHLSIHGVVEGKDVWLRIVARQPNDLEAGQLVTMPAGTAARRW
jgi:hypothetical protein